MVMRVRAEHYPYETSVVAEQLFPSSQLLSEITGVTCSRIRLSWDGTLSRTKRGSTRME